MAELKDLKLKYRLFVSTYKWRRVDPVPLARRSKPLSECRVALVSSAGFVVPGDEPFDTELKGGDWSFRTIPHDEERTMNARRPLNGTVTLFALIVVGLLAYQSTATRPVPARPTTIATVNLENVFNGLNARAEADAGLERLAEELKQQADELAREIDALKEDLELYPKNSDNYQTTLESFTLKSLEYQAFVEFSRRKIEVEKALTLKRIYRSIKTAARTLSEENGWDVVFVDDSVAEMQAGTEAEANRQISARRMLYTNPEIDITQALIDYMNQA